MKKEEFIADLIQLKMSLARPLMTNQMYAEPNFTYAVIETLVATFMDKYKVKYEDVMKVFQERSITPNPTKKKIEEIDEFLSATNKE